MRGAKEEMAPFTAHSKSAHKGESALQHTNSAKAGPCTKGPVPCRNALTPK